MSQVPKNTIPGFSPDNAENPTPCSTIDFQGPPSSVFIHSTQRSTHLNFSQADTPTSPMPPHTQTPSLHHRTILSSLSLLLDDTTALALPDHCTLLPAIPFTTKHTSTTFT